MSRRALPILPTGCRLAELWGALQAHYGRSHPGLDFLTPGLQEALLGRLHEMGPEIRFLRDSNPGGDSEVTPPTAGEGSYIDGVVLKVRGAWWTGGQVAPQRLGGSPTGREPPAPGLAASEPERFALPHPNARLPNRLPLPRPRTTSRTQQWVCMTRG